MELHVERTAGALAQHAGELLRARRMTLAVAESCTGGGLGDAITDIAGSSEYFQGGLIAYSYEAKKRLLAVPRDLLAAKGAVSPEVVTTMAAGARRILQTDLALALSGIAGPGGGMPGKPVGLVYIALATPQGTAWRRHLCQGNRIENKRASVCAALEWLIEYLQEQRQRT
ncbi:MAG TPA: CinA family protein [Anaerolineae bacterium]|nr:CinA family protein [Anaerolineae bacterium]HPL26951.1 CinA family protein [Anaerolineae bacterium]